MHGDISLSWAPDNFSACFLCFSLQLPFFPCVFSRCFPSHFFYLGFLCSGNSAQSFLLLGISLPMFPSRSSPRRFGLTLTEPLFLVAPGALV